jgi:adenylate cyclase
MLYGTVLSMDVVRYEAIKAKMLPDDFTFLMNDQDNILCTAVKKYHGIVLDYTNGSMLAIWVNSFPDTTFNQLACLAALDIVSVLKINQGVGDTEISVRIGICLSHIVQARLTSGDSLNDADMGHIVKVASKIKEINKYMNTSILVSEEVLEHTRDFLTRNIGEFCSVSQSRSFMVHELMRQDIGGHDPLKKRLTLFSKAIYFYKIRQWSQAIAVFSRILNEDEKDGPTLFYIHLCKHFMENPPPEGWCGTVRF